MNNPDKFRFNDATEEIHEFDGKNYVFLTTYFNAYIESEMSDSEKMDKVKFWQDEQNEIEFNNYFNNSI